MKNQGKIFFTFLAFIIFIMTILPRSLDARFIGDAMSRQRRGSDQRIAELETLLALSKMRAILVTVPIAFGRVDPAKIGRKRRSMDGDKLQRLRDFLRVNNPNANSNTEEETDNPKEPSQLLVVYSPDEENGTQLN